MTVTGQKTFSFIEDEFKHHLVRASHRKKTTLDLPVINKRYTYICNLFSSDKINLFTDKNFVPFLVHLKILPGLYLP